MSNIILGRGLTRQTKRRLFVASALAPILLWFIIFMFLPILMVIFYSFTNAHMAYSDYSFVGLKQYTKMLFRDTLVPTSLWNTIKIVLYAVPATTVLSVLLAMGLNSVSERLSRFSTFAFFLPSIVCSTAICLVWKWLFNQHYGLFNAILEGLGLPPQPFLSSSSQVLPCLALMQVWSLVGYYGVILLAAIRSIDPSIYEAAEIDGANAWQRNLHITLPLIRQNTLFVSIMATTQSFMIFTPVKVMTDGKPGTSSMVLMLHIINKGISNSDVAYASCMSILMMVIILFISLIQWGLTNGGKQRDKKRGAAK